MGNTNSRKIDKFHGRYVDWTNDGVVLNLDISERGDLGPRFQGTGTIVLTDDEVAERWQWIRLKDQISRYYRFRQLPTSLSQEDFLKLRVAAPCLHPNPRNVSTRSPPADHRHNRHYPPGLHAWDNFGTSVEAFLVTGDSKVSGKAVEAVRSSLAEEYWRGSEQNEEQFLHKFAIDPLERAGLIGTVQLGEKDAQGDPDFSIFVPERTGEKRTRAQRIENMRIVGETKTTHNLPLPMRGVVVSQQYNNARQAVDALPEPQEDEQRRPLGWSHVGHPLSQILGYMILNQCRYGVLTCGSRTYFLHLRHDNAQNEEVALISDAWFVGQRNYLRAWAFFYAASQADTQPRLDRAALSDAWLLASPEKVNKRPRPYQPMGYDGPASQRQRTSRSARPGRGRGQNRRSASGWLNTECVPTVGLGDFQVGTPLGYGRRGTTFRATWQGEDVAVKLFDTHKNNGGDAFSREIKAYAYLRKAWGQLVPTPKFVSEAFGVIYFGMQLAEDPPESVSSRDWDNVLRELEEKYYFRHLDLEGPGRGPGLHNRMMLRDSAGCTRPILIDLEEYELID